MDSDLKKASQAIDGLISRAVQNLIAPAPAGSGWKGGLDELRRVRAATIRELQGLTQIQADFHPKAGVWSIAQNADHVLLSEKFYARQIARLMEMAGTGGAKTLEITFAEVNPSFAVVPPAVLSALSAPLSLMNMFVPGIVRESIIRYPLFPAVAPNVMDPAASRPIESLLESMQLSLIATEALFSGEIPGGLDAVAVSHPLLGRNSVEQLLGLMGAHEQRHRDQIARIRSAADFPRG